MTLLVTLSACAADSFTNEVDAIGEVSSKNESEKNITVETVDKFEEDLDASDNLSIYFPDDIDIPSEIKAVFFEDRIFNYVFYIAEVYDGENHVTRGTIQTNIEDFSYDYFADLAEDGSYVFSEYDICWNKCTALDLDHDEVNELIYYVYQGGDGYYIIFHVINNEVYGYSVTYRSIDLLYNDGTIEGYDGADYYDFRVIESFSEKDYSESVLAAAEGGNFYISCEEVTEQQFEHYVARWKNEETIVDWFEVGNLP